MNQPQIKDVVWQWLSSNVGTRHVFKITLGQQLVSGNSISGSINGEAFDSIAFAGSHNETMTKIAESIQATSEVLKCEVTSSLELTCTSLEFGSDNGEILFTVSGGASQPSAVIATLTAPVAVTCYFANQKMPINVPRPFATIRIGQLQPVSSQHLQEINDTTNLALLSDHVQATVSINYFGENALGELAKAFHSLALPQSIDLFSAGGVAVGQRFQIQDLSQFLDTEIEERAAFDFYIRFKTLSEADLGLIETVEITGVIDADGPSITAGPYVITV